MLSLFIGLRYTRARRRSQLVSFISGISIVGLIVSVALLSLVLSVMNGFDQQLRERILSIAPQVMVLNNTGVEDWQALRDQVLQQEGVVAGVPFIQLGGGASYKRLVVPVNIYGVDPKEEGKVSSIENFMPAGQLEKLAGADSDSVIFVGQGVADELGIEVGKRLRVIIQHNDYNNSLPAVHGFEVAGIISTGTLIDQNIALISLNKAMQLSTHPGRVDGIKLKVEDLLRAPSLSYQIIRSLPRGYYGRDWTSYQGNLYQATQLSKKLVGMLLFLIIGIAAFNVVSTLIMVTIDKQSDIAILRTLGSSTHKIMAIFMVQGTVIGITGTSIGLLLGWVLASYVDDFVPWLESLIHYQFLKSDVYHISFIPSQPLAADFILIACVSLALSFVATLYPAWRASKVKPADALRFEF
ncbi:lipoprotein-releasing ABC transporter permease subunit [Aurantivibrio infirmus]